MKINTDGLLGFENKADVKNDAMIGCKNSKPRRRKKWKKRKWRW